MKDREIKFRAWDGKLMYAPFTLIEGLNDKHKWYAGNYPVHTLFLQFTGLKDKNGKEIYEGDIVSFTRPVGNWTGKRMTTEHKIYFEEHICAFVLESVGNYTKLRNGRTYEYEVLGNVYENAGLLAVAP